MDAREGRLGAVIGGVMRQALDDARAPALVLIDDGSPESGLLERILAPALHDRFGVLSADGAMPADLLRAWARIATTRPGALVALAVNKTAALLGGALPGPVLPFGDVWASQVAELAGGWSAPERVRALAQSVGGIAPLDRALQALVDRRLPAVQACAGLPADQHGTLLALWEDTRFARRRTGLVPKLGPRTIGIDLFD